MTNTQKKVGLFFFLEKALRLASLSRGKKRQGKVQSLLNGMTMSLFRIQ